jgi:putative ABC transport system permease protein
MHFIPSFDTILHDLRFAARALARRPGFTAIAIVTLALGIGANAATFSVVNAVLLRPLPWHEPDRAVMIWSKWTAFDKTWVATGEVVDYRRRSRTLADVAAWAHGQVNLTGDGDPERVMAASVSANIFSTLGVSPFFGRAFTAAEDLPKGPKLVVLGHGLWSRRYASDHAIIGRAIQINGESHEVVGVLPPDVVLPTDFQNPTPSQLWVPLQMDPASTDHGSHGLFAAGRLRPDATLAQASDELHTIARDLTREGFYPVQMEFDTVVVSLTDEVVGSVRRSIWLLLGAVAFLLLIACANVANLLLARAEGRQREIAVRVAVGASGARLVGQLLTEGLVLTSVATVAGLALAFAGIRFVAWWNPASVPRIATVTVDGRVLLFTAAVAIVTSLVFSLAPAVRALRVDLTDALKDGAQGASSGHERQQFRNGLVVLETALAVVLLVGAGLMLRSLWSLQRVDLGFDPSRVLTLRLSLPSTSYPQPEQVVAFYSELVDRVRQIPGVQSAGAVRALPLASTIGDFGLRIDGYMPPPGTGAKGDWQIATDGYIEAMGERVIRGRSIAVTDSSDAMPVALINEEMARRYWPDREALGGRFRIGGGNNPPRPWVTVVGIVRDVRHNNITDMVKEKFYVPHTQWHKSVGNPIRGMSLVIKTDQDPVHLARTVRQTIREMDSSLPVADVRTMDAVVAATLSTPRFTGMLLGAFATLALALSAIGIYGVLSYVVSRRTREIGIRVAIGAGRAQVLRLVLRSGLGFAVAGIGVGLVIATVLSQLMTTLLHGVKPFDPTTFIVVPVTLTLVALLASLVPAWRATRVDPVRALKSGD